MADSENELDPQRVADALREVRSRARAEPPARPALPPHEAPSASPALPPLASGESAPAPRSPDRRLLNEIWDVGAGGDERPRGPLGRLFAPLRGPIRRLLRFALGPVVERQVAVNSAQVRFDNELVGYIDARIDRMADHYDRLLGLHGKRMEEIDERHLILQQELVRHVHDLVKRIEFVFESAEQNHLYLEGALRELREELARLSEKLTAPKSS